MTLTSPKRMYLSLGITFFLFLLCLFLAIFFSQSGAYHGAFLRNDPSISLWRGEKVVLNESESHPLPGGDWEILAVNEEREDYRVLVIAGDQVLADVSLSAKEEKKISLSLSSESHLSLVALGEKTAAFLSDAEALSSAKEAMTDGGDLIFLRPVSLDEEKFSAPFRFFGSFSLKEMALDTEKKGKIVLCPEEEQTATVYLSAPQAVFYTRGVSFSFPKDSYDYYLKAVSWNGKKLKPEVFPIANFEELKRLSQENSLPKMQENAKLVFYSSFVMKDDVSFGEHASLEFLSPVDFSDYRILFSSDQEGVYSVKTALGASVLCQSIHLDAPRSYLYWEGEGAIPAISTVEKKNNLSYYNGVRLNLGGEGEAIPQLTLLSAENEFLSHDLVFLPEGNLLKDDLPYLLSLSDLNGATYHISCENGTAHLEGTLSDGVIVATDLQGKTRRYAVDAARESNQIPVLFLETENGAEITSKSQYINATLQMNSGEENTASLGEVPIRIRGRGNSTWKWEKKPYKIHFAEPTSLFGLPEAEEWALFANYADKSLMRNRLAQVMAEKLSFSYCPTQEYVDVFLNGEYIGVYGLGEHLEEGAGRIEVEYDMNQVDCGYFIEAGGVVAGVDVKGMNYFHADLIKFALIKGPEYNALTSEQFDYIQQYFLDASTAVRDGEGYENYVNVETLIDWLIMIELSNNIDCAYRRSTYFTKDTGGLLEMGPVWDFDLAFGNFSKDDPDYNKWISTDEEDDYVGITWSTYLLKDPEFQQMFKKRWEEVRDLLIQTALESIESDYRLLVKSAELNFQRWQILGVKVAFEPHSTKYYKTYFSQIEYLKDFLINRAAWIDTQVALW